MLCDEKPTKVKIMMFTSCQCHACIDEGGKGLVLTMILGTSGHTEQIFMIGSRYKIKHNNMYNIAYAIVVVFLFFVITYTIAI